jgi:alpha-amylase/alpha-mannosidase (GH57 family)
MEQAICIHGHFYQPSRENPWLEKIEIQKSASPYHDWNERITAQCYGPNTAARILDAQNRIVQTVNNYAKMSFNFGPTLLSWLEQHEPETYQAILDADKESRQRFSGHGSALAQAYNHMIMPLANSRDKYTQIFWGIRDFEKRFGRKPEGMWLPETAVDLETLDLLSNQGIIFTILAPNQARRVRSMGTKSWEDVSGGKIDSTRPYNLRLPSGSSIALFFFDGSISRAIAFEGLLGKGKSFVRRLVSGFSNKQTKPQIVHVATDGESYGHHHRFGEMALAYAINTIELSESYRLTNYGEYLEKNPPEDEVKIIEYTAWSCAHGVDRWRYDCGCNSGKHPEWSQTWREPLRKAMNRLRDKLSGIYIEKADPLLDDPWKARNQYIHVVLDRSDESVESFLRRFSKQTLSRDEKTTVLKLLEMQRHAQLMFTSCGWFFDDISGIETIQNLRHAARAIHITKELTNSNIEPDFLKYLSQAKSNRSDYGNGHRVYVKHVKPTIFDLKRSCAHHAIYSHFYKDATQASLGCYSGNSEDYQVAESQKTKLSFGRAVIWNNPTRDSATFLFGVLQKGDYDIRCGIGKYKGKSYYELFVRELKDSLKKGKSLETLKIFDRYFNRPLYKLNSVFQDQQQTILKQIVNAKLSDTASVYRQLYKKSSALIKFIVDSGNPLPPFVYSLAQVVLNSDLLTAFEQGEIDTKHIKAPLRDAAIADISLDVSILEYALRKRLESKMKQFMNNPDNLSMIHELEGTVEIVDDLPFTLNLWKVQKDIFTIYRNRYHKTSKQAGEGNKKAKKWLKYFNNLANKLSIRLQN